MSRFIGSWRLQPEHPTYGVGHAVMYVGRIGRSDDKEVPVEQRVYAMFLMVDIAATNLLPRRSEWERVL